MSISGKSFFHRFFFKAYFSVLSIMFDKKKEICRS